MKKAVLIFKIIILNLFLVLMMIEGGCSLDFDYLNIGEKYPVSGESKTERDNSPGTGGIVASEASENIPPVAIIDIYQHDSVDDYFRVGNPVYFSAGSSLDADGDDLSFQWLIGDGEVIAGEEFSYIFEDTGEYLIKLVVDDGSDSVTISKRIYLADISVGVSATGFYDVTVGIEYLITNDSPVELEDVICLLQIPQTYKPFQSIKNIRSNYSKKDDIYTYDYNIIARFNLGNIAPGDSAKAYVNCDVTLCEYDYLDAGNEAYSSYDPGDSDLSLYTKAEYYIDSDSPQIKSAAKEIIGEETSPVFVAEKLYNYVVDRMIYDEEKLQERVRTYRYASDIIRSGEGVCSDYAVLYIALCRAAGIPAKFSQGIPVFSILQEKSGSLQYGHAWAEIKLPGYGWIPIDITAESGFMSHNYYLNLETYKGSGIFFRSLLIDGAGYYPSGFYYSWKGNTEPDVLIKTDYSVTGMDTQDIPVISEDSFLENTGRILSEYNLAINHVNMAHPESWIFNDTEEIAVEETFLTRLIELSEELEEISYPVSYSDDRNNLLEISHRIIQHKDDQIKCMKDGNYECSMNENSLFVGCLTELFDYYSGMVQKFNQKY
jgi:hypothetical protein